MFLLLSLVWFVMTCTTVHCVTIFAKYLIAFVRPWRHSVCQHKSSKTARQNFMWLYSWSGHTVYICIFTRNSDFIFFWENMDLNILFFASRVKPVEHVYMNLNDREAVWICLWQWTFKCNTNVTIINRLCVTDYYQYSIIIGCPIGPH